MSRSEIRINTTAGTVLSTVFNLGMEDIFRTVILAAVGAIVSYGVSVVLKKIQDLNRKKE